MDGFVVLARRGRAGYVEGLVSQPDRILVLQEKARRLRLLRESSFPSLCTYFSIDILLSEAQARRGEEAEVDPDQFQDPDNDSNSLSWSRPAS